MNPYLTLLNVMNPNYNSEEILSFLEGRENEENTNEFWQAVAADERLRLEVEALQLLIEQGRRSRYQKLLREMEEFEEDENEDNS